jgi:hypothetical protein
MSDDIYDFPLDNFPSLIAKLIRQRVLKIVRKELEAKGFVFDQIPPAYVRQLCEAYFETHKAECIKVAGDTVRIAAGLIELAQREARQRGPTLPSLIITDSALTLAKGKDYDVIESEA